MIDGFPIQRANQFGGRDTIPYAEATFFEKDAAIATNVGTSSVAKLPDSIRKSCPKEHLAKLAAIRRAFVKTEKDCELYSMGNADHWFDKWKKEAIESGELGSAPASKNDVKDRMRNLKREMRSNFKAKHFRAYHSMVKDLLEAVIPAITKLIETEDAQEISRLKAYGVEPQLPSVVVAGFFTARRALVNHLVSTEAALSGGESATIGMEVNGDLLRLLGVEV